MLNSNFRQVVRVDKRTLAAELNAWATCERMLTTRALSTRTTKRVLHCDFKAGATSSFELFNQTSWQAHIAREPTTFSGDVSAAPEERRRRRGPSKEQEEILQAVRANVGGTGHTPVFDLSTKKRSRY